MTDHWQIIESVLEDERDRHIINGGKAEHRKELDAAIAFVREQRAATVRGQPLDAPDAPGWWAFEGTSVPIGEERQWRNVYEIVENKGELVTVFGPYNMPMSIKHLVGKWRRMTMPWDVDTLTQRPQPADAKDGGGDDGE